MSQDSKRHAQLDDKKERAAGRHKNPRQGRERDFGSASGRSGQIGGAFGSSGGNKQASGRASNLSKGAGGGGAAQTSPGE